MTRGVRMLLVGLPLPTHRTVRLAVGMSRMPPARTMQGAPGDLCYDSDSDDGRTSSHDEEEWPLRRSTPTTAMMTRGAGYAAPRMPCSAITTSASTEHKLLAE